MTVTYRSRQDWGGGPVAAGHPVDGLSFVRLAEHHTVIVMPDYDHDGMVAGDIDDFDAYMRALKVVRPDLGPDVPYSYCIAEGASEWDCIVGEGRGNRHTGAHTIGFNSTALGCAWAGDFTSKSPTPGMYEGLRWVGRTMLADPARALPTIQHRDVYATQCPGLSTPSPSLAQPPFTSLVPPAQEAADMTPAVVTTSDGRNLIYVVGDDQSAYEHSDAHGWRAIGGKWTSGLAAVRGADDSVTLFGRGTDGQLWGLPIDKAGTAGSPFPVGGHIFPPA